MPLSDTFTATTLPPVEQLHAHIRTINRAERKCHDLMAMLARRLILEEALAKTSKLLISSDMEEFDEVLAVLGKAMQTNRAYIFQIRDEGRRMDNTFEWCVWGTKPQRSNLQDLDTDLFPWWMEKLRRDENIVLFSLEDLPAAATAERTVLANQGIESLLVVPMFSGTRLHGFLGFDDTEKHRDWLEEDIHLLRAAAGMLVAHLERLESRRLRDIMAQELEAASARNLAPDLEICANCKRIQDEDGHWIPLELYLNSRTKTRLDSHTCPYCRKKLFPEFYGGRTI